MVGNVEGLTKVISVSIQVYNRVVERVENVKCLDATFSSDMTWTGHTNYLSAKINERLGLLKRTKHFLPRFARVLYYNSY